MIAFTIKLVIGLVAAVGLIDRLRGTRRFDRRFLTEALFTFLAAFVFVMVGSALYALAAPFSHRAGLGGALALLLFLVTYVGFAGLWLARMAPKSRPLPAWVGQRFGAIDVALLAPIGLILGGLYWYGG
ncbi:MAG: hypothetical protein JNM13_11175 [Hyphomicrobiaceae bacterium]|nr:hypothetical protein [Hyphomicrobiaceae bacterium]